MDFFKLICCKNCIVCLKKTKINVKQAGHGALKLYTRHNRQSCHFWLQFESGVTKIKKKRPKMVHLIGLFLNAALGEGEIKTF